MDVDKAPDSGTTAALGQEPGLKRSLNLPLLTLYGLGTTIGGGIYILIGSVAGRAGLYAPISFVMASVLALFSALTFAELSARHPVSAGEAVYVEKGFGLPSLGMVVGLLVAVSGIVSSGALASGFVGYFQTLLPVPQTAAVIAIAFVLGLLAVWGIGESVTVAALITVFEIGGLALVVWAGRGAFTEAALDLPRLIPSLDGAVWAGIMGGSFLAYYAFIGFEDMVNVAEETRDVRRNLPRAIVLTLILTTILYAAVALVAVLSVPARELAASDAPLALLFHRTSGQSGAVIGIIGVFAVLNGALIQIIMVSRVLYGMSRQGWLPKLFGSVNPRTQTPVAATGITIVLIAVLALSFPIDQLAQFTSVLILLVAVLVNASLWRIKHRQSAPADIFQVPIWIPIIGVVVSLLFAVLTAWDLAGQFFSSG